MAQQPKGDEPKITLQSEKKKESSIQGLKQYQTPIAIFIATVVIVGVILLTRTPQTTQGSGQTVVIEPTQEQLIITATPQVVVQPTQPPVVITATPLPPQPTQPPIVVTATPLNVSGGVTTVDGGTTVCPPATNDNYSTPTTVTVKGRAIVHPWWNNNKPSWGQKQVRILLSPDETVTFVDMMGRVYTYQNTPACEAIMPQEFGNATFPIVTIQDLVSQGLAKTDTCPTSPSEVAGLIGGQARYWDFEPTSQHTGWLYAAGSPAVTMTAPNFGHIDYWNGQAGKISNGQQAQNVTQATFWCGG